MTRKYKPRTNIKTPSERVLRRIRKTKNGCWLWCGPVNNVGYGLIHGGKGEPKMITVHRAVAKYYCKWDIQGKEVLHTCKNLHCVNPDHLQLGTKQERIEKTVGRKDVMKKIWRNSMRTCKHCGGTSVFTWFSRKHADCYTYIPKSNE